MKKLLLSLGVILLPQAFGAIGAIFTTPNIDSWYNNLVKPVFAPPNWIFGPVWTILYLMMGVSLFLIWNKGKKKHSFAIKLFIMHLFFNMIWSILFFGLKDMGMAFLDIIILWVLIVYIIVEFEKINKTAAYLLFPYLFWVTFASILNFAYWTLNLS